MCSSDLAEPAPPWTCSAAVSSEAVPVDGPLLRAAAVESEGLHTSAPDAAAPPAPPPDYRQRLATTVLGRPRLDRWCVWIEPPSGSPIAALWEHRWRSAVTRALSQWQALLPIRLVDDPSAAQVRLWRRRPPLVEGPEIGRAHV